MRATSCEALTIESMMRIQSSACELCLYFRPCIRKHNTTAATEIIRLFFEDQFVYILWIHSRHWDILGLRTCIFGTSDLTALGGWHANSLVPSEVNIATTCLPSRRRFSLHKLKAFVDLLETIVSLIRNCLLQVVVVQRGRSKFEGGQTKLRQGG